MAKRREGWEKRWGEGGVKRKPFNVGKNVDRPSCWNSRIGKKREGTQIYGKGKKGP